MSLQEVGLSKFAWTLLIVQITFAILFLLLVRDYHHDTGHGGLEKYPRNN